MTLYYVRLYAEHHMTLTRRGLARVMRLWTTDGNGRRHLSFYGDAGPFTCDEAESYARRVRGLRKTLIKV
jgi:hypothetical protein